MDFAKMKKNLIAMISRSVHEHWKETSDSGFTEERRVQEVILKVRFDIEVETFGLIDLTNRGLSRLICEEIERVKGVSGNNHIAFIFL